MAVVLTGFAAWAVYSAGRGVLSVGANVLHALWLVPAMVALHLTQLMLSARGWHLLLPGVRLLRCYRLRIMREGIDSLLPVAQVGGEIVAVKLLAMDGVGQGVAAASVIVDVTVEFLTQLVFLLTGITALALLAPDGGWQAWLGAAVLTVAAGGALLAAQRFGLLRAVEALGARIAARWPALGSLAGINDAAAGMYRRVGRLVQASLLHLLAWLLGSVESWAVLHSLGWPVSAAQALVVEALGMAARSAGFAVPGALVVQETGFALAVAAVGLPNDVGVSLSLIKRVREVVTGLIGVTLWRAEVFFQSPALR